MTVRRTMVLMYAALIAVSCNSCSKEAGAMFDDLRSIGCQVMLESKFKETLANEKLKGVKPVRGRSVEVGVSFNLDGSGLSEGFMSVYSSRAGDSPIYHGEIRKDIAVTVPEELFNRGGVDNVHFLFFDVPRSRVCAQMQDGGAVYWLKGENVRIEFLKNKEVDPDIGTPIGHRVSHG